MDNQANRQTRQTQVDKDMQTDTQMAADFGQAEGSCATIAT